MTGWWRSHGLRMRLTRRYIGAMLVVLAVYASVIYGFVSRSVSQALDQQLHADSALAAATVDRTGDGSIFWMVPEALDPETELPWLQVWSADGRERLFSSAEANRLPVPESQALAARADNTISTIQTDGQSMRVLSRRDSIGPLPVVIQVARSEAALRTNLQELALIMILGLPLAVAVAGFVGYTLARGALAPIERMGERARMITAERLNERLPIDNPADEMGRLATVFNQTLGRLEESFEQMRRFTADVSHELRTPLTAIRSVGEVGLRGHRDEAAYRGIIGSMLEEADRLATLVDRLLTLSRAETGQAKLSIEPVPLAPLAEDVAAHLGVLAEEKKQSIAIERDGAPEAMADRLVLRQALISLVDNAIKFSPSGGSIRIRVREAGGDAVLEVADTGEGIAQDAQPRIFDRFFRADGIGEGGTGLGLSIARGAVEASGGRLTLEQSDSHGSTFRITMPRSTVRRRAAG
jgi:heavy metal sensor kinase